LFLFPLYHRKHFHFDKIFKNLVETTFLLGLPLFSKLAACLALNINDRTDCM